MLETLAQPPLIDLTTLKSSDVIKVCIMNTTHRFSSISAVSGTDITKNPLSSHVGLCCRVFK